MTLTTNFAVEVEVGEAPADSADAFCVAVVA